MSQLPLRLFSPLDDGTQLRVSWAGRGAGGGEAGPSSPQAVGECVDGELWVKVGALLPSLPGITPLPWGRGRLTGGPLGISCLFRVPQGAVCILRHPRRATALKQPCEQEVEGKGWTDSLLRAQLGTGGVSTRIYNICSSAHRGETALRGAGVGGNLQNISTTLSTRFCPPARPSGAAQPAGLAVQGCQRGGAQVPCRTLLSVWDLTAAFAVT